MIYIGTHVMPWEVGEFRHQVRLHRLTMIHLEKKHLNNITLVPTLNLNDEIIDWGNSKLPKEYYIEHFKISCKTLEDTIQVKPRIGGVTSTTEALKRNIEDILTDEDYYLWMDPDISYPYTYWSTLLESFEVLQNHPGHFIITPSTTKLWDQSWDILVNEDQLSLPYGDEGWYNSKFEDYFYTDLEASLTQTPTIKLGGGFGNLFSGKTLKLFGVPDGYILYGGIDTYVMIGAEFLRQRNLLIQYRMQNIVTIQDFKFSDKEMYKSFTPTFLAKDDQRELNENKNKIYQKSINTLINKLNGIL
tara:strand:- start:924 stop:1832 length:909 start_codon:yes stop_codon:yes gene_type:complete